MSRQGDWNCRSCQHMNFQQRDSCQRCGEPRHDPNVMPVDWYCNVANCGAHNFASRSRCFKCGASKDDLATAGGGGGGFDADMSRRRVFRFGVR